MAKSMVYVETKGDLIWRIIPHTHLVWNLPEETIQQWPRSEAVKTIRDQVFARSGGECEDCGARVTKVTGEMHERLPRGKGGEISMTNCCFLCHACHQGRPDSEHGARRFQTSKKGPNESTTLGTAGNEGS